MDLLVAIVSYKTILSVPRKGLTTSWLSTLKPGTVLGRKRFGGFLLWPLIVLPTGARVPVRFDTSGLLKLPPSPAPLVMIGPGTGVAPFRALMEERIRAGADGEFKRICSLYIRSRLSDAFVVSLPGGNGTENLLFFGCRSVKADFYFREFWEDLAKQGKLTLSVAPSRDQVSWPLVHDRDAWY